MRLFFLAALLFQFTLYCNKNNSRADKTEKGISYVDAKDNLQAMDSPASQETKVITIEKAPKNKRLNINLPKTYQGSWFNPNYGTLTIRNNYSYMILPEKYDWGDCDVCIFSEVYDSSESSAIVNCRAFSNLEDSQKVVKSIVKKEKLCHRPTPDSGEITLTLGTTKEEISFMKDGKKMYDGAIFIKR